MFLGDDWLAFVLARGAELPEQPGASLVMQHVVTASAAGKVQLFAEVRDGRLVALGLGKRADATCTITWTYEDAVAVLRGESLDVAYMQGRLKIEGAYRAFLLNLRPVVTSPQAIALLEEIRAITEV